jgi:hypothetical protein
MDDDDLKCPECGGEEWDEVVWKPGMGVPYFKPYRECWCGAEWEPE